MNDELLTQNNIPKRSQKKTAGIVLLLAICLFFIGKQFSASPPADIKKLLNITAAELNKSCPKFENATTRLDNAADGKTFQYNYTLTDLLRDSTDLDVLYVGLETAMISNAKNNPDLEIFRNNNVTLIYKVNDKAGELLARIQVTPEKYK
jgi:hypothetical protein